jgi:ATP-binding cassette subfamily B protein
LNTLAPSPRETTATASTLHEPATDRTGFTIDTDISLEGGNEPHRLTCRSGELIITHADGTEEIRRLPLDTVEASRTISCVGCGILQVKIAGEWQDLLGFSNALSERFHQVSRRLDRLAGNLTEEGNDGHDPAAEEEAGFEPVTCPACQLRLGKEHETCPRCLQKGRILGRVWELLRPYSKSGLIVIALTIVGVVAELVPPKLQQYMVDHLLMDQGKLSEVEVQQALLYVVLALAFSRVLLSVVGVIKGQLSSLIGAGITCNLRKQMVGKLQNMAVAYYDRHEVGSLISRVAHDSEVLHGLMQQLTGGFLLQIGQLVGVGAMLFWLNPKLALFTLIPVPLVFLGTWVFWRKVYPRYYRLWDASAKQMVALSGMLSGIRVVKAFAQEERENAKFKTATEYLRDWRVWVEYANARYSASMQVVFSLGGLIVWYVGGRDVIGDEMTLGELIAFLAYLAMFYAPLGALSHFTTWLTSFLSGSKRVMELLDSPLTIADPATPVAWTERRGAIEFDRVTFGYDVNQPVLKDITFAVAPGEMVGIVGRSGSGKTTMVNLLGRFYDPQGGAVKIDGIDIRDLSLSELRQHLGIVLQDSFLFRGTIWKNLSYGTPDTPVETALARAKAAGAHDFICNKALAYETLLGEGGSGLSGGEKQRLSIARTLLYDPKILVLDEATSNIDAESEKNIQDALSVLVKGRTTIAIAHRLSTLRNADRILVFDRGRIAESGSHAELLDEDGIYARLVRIQTRVSKDPNVDKLLVHTESEPVSDVDAGSEDSTGPSLQWLEPDAVRFFEKDGQLFAAGQGCDEADSRRVFLIRTFPASRPDQYLSVRYWTPEGDDKEWGMLRDFADWPEETRSLLSTALKRRYLLRSITRVHALRLEQGYLDLDVDAAGTRMSFTMRWTAGSVSDFGENGKLMTDTNGNRFLVEDLNSLPREERERFLHYVYW